MASPLQVTRWHSMRYWTSVLASRVSICLPTYNGERFLAAALDSVLTQSFRDFELIIVDDASTDGTTHIIETYAAKDSRIKYHFNKTSTGLFTNYNACMNLAENEYVKPFAQDDLLHKDALAECVRILDERPEVSIVSLQRIVIDECGNDIDVSADYRDRLPMDLPLTAHEVAAQCLFPINNCIGEPSTVMFRRRDQGKGFSLDLMQVGDIEYWVRLSTAGHLYLSSKPYCYFRCHDASTTSSNVNSMASAADVITIARKHQWMFELCSRKEEEFFERNLADLSLQTVHSIEKGLLDQYRVRLAGEQQKEAMVQAETKEDIEALYDQLETFRELAFHCLRLMSHATGHKEAIKQTEVRHTNGRKIDKLENELRTLLGSHSWRMTKPLRDFKRMVYGQAIPASDEEFAEASGVDAAHQQELYIYHLRGMISKVKTSQSWKVTEPLRFRVSRRRSK